MSYIVGYLLGVVLVFLMPISIGVYVYRDATRRGMNAVLWVLVSVFAPSLIGFIIYLVVRENYSDLQCPQCNTKITEQYVVCPSCGAKLQPTCSNCGNVVSPEWKICPVCTKDLSGDYSDVVTPQHKKDKTLWKILLLVILIPVILIVMMVAGITLYGANISTPSSGVSAALTSVPYEEFYEAEDDAEIKEMLATAKKDNKAHIMEYNIVNDAGENEYYYLVYIPGAGELDNMHMCVENVGWFRKVFKLELSDCESEEEMVYCLVTTREKSDGIELYFNNTKYECKVIKVDYNPVEDYCKGGTLIEKGN